MKNTRILAAILCLAITTVTAPALAEDYPGADLQQADQLEAQASEAIESGHQRHADTRTAEFLFQKAQYEVSARHGKEAKRYFSMAIDAMRPAPAPVDAAAPGVAQDSARDAATDLETPPARVAPALAGDGEAAAPPASTAASSATAAPAPKRHHRRHARRHHHHRSHST